MTAMEAGLGFMQPEVTPEEEEEPVLALDLRIGKATESISIFDDKGPVLQKLNSAENLTDKFSTSNWGLNFCPETTDVKLFKYYEQ
jgi:hypothetical protein